MAKLDANKLYGRKEELEVIKSKLRQNSFLALISPRLGGKSALLSKGLKPSLEQEGFQGKAGNQWKVLMLEPDSDPIASLSEVLAQKNILMEKNIRPDFEEYLYDYLSENNNHLSYLYKESEYIKDFNLLLIVDNVISLFEENNKEKDDFIDLLLTAAFREDVAIYVLFALAKEELNYIPNTQRFARLWDAIEDSNFQLFAMNQSELEEALLNTMEESGNKLDSHITNELLDELYFDAEQLPNLRNYLSKIESGLDSREIKKELYRPKIKGKGDTGKTGNIEHIKKKHISGSQLINRGIEKRKTVKHSGAEAIYKKLKTRYQQTVCEGIFKSLVYRDAESGELEFKKRSIKQIAELTDFPISELGKVIEIFSKEGVLNTNNELYVAKSIVGLDDEGILGGWKTLDSWVEEESEKRVFYIQVCALAVQFLKTDDKDLLITGSPLNKLHELIREGEISEGWSKYYNEDFGSLEPYMNACDVENSSASKISKTRTAKPSARPAARRSGKIQIGIKKGGRTPKLKIDEGTSSSTGVKSSISGSIADKMAVLESKYGINPFGKGDQHEEPPQADEIVESAADDLGLDVEIGKPETEADNLVEDLLEQEVVTSNPEISGETEEGIDQDEEEEEAIDFIEDILDDIEAEESLQAKAEELEEPKHDQNITDKKSEDQKETKETSTSKKSNLPESKKSETRSKAEEEPALDEELDDILDDILDSESEGKVESKPLEVKPEEEVVGTDIEEKEIKDKVSEEGPPPIAEPDEPEVKEEEKPVKKVKSTRKKLVLKKLDNKSNASPKVSKARAKKEDPVPNPTESKEVVPKKPSGTKGRKKLVIKKRK